MFSSFLKLLGSGKILDVVQDFGDLAQDSKEIKQKVDTSLDNLSEALLSVKKYQEEVVKVKNLWELTFNSVDPGLAILDNNSNIVNANHSFLEIVGKLKEEIIGHLICEVFCGIDHDGYSPCKECCAQEYVYKHHRLYKIHFNRMLDKENELMGCVFIAHDITEENQIQQYLSEMTSKYMSIFKAAKDPIVLFDTKTKKIQEVNAAFTELYGWGLSEAIGKSVIDDISAEPEETAKAIDSHIDRIPLRFHKKKDGTIFPVEVSASYYNFGGEISCVAIIRDLSDKLNSEVLASLQNLVSRIKLNN
jgi:PAS domain S-box-containing protein